ncbi:DUF305 domain-containing protein [Nocardia farcinica]|uniref:DUF305 domain-containing protein n=1 Tax=Nocardia farcinica TaxID=37329 RepID=UPI0018946421|nr:DUF305 domain-containing protein [Nocardia farcinica]MBF6417356.1 DUF305 domain-containing protein [Nocardia farcinica]MBF6429138.1 DUF305 domain-containing protein [Nocardia farcinica]MBF6503801.1 DUF305 domain-containing protein [Nocardia farcinica]
MTSRTTLRAAIPAVLATAALLAGCGDDSGDHDTHATTASSTTAGATTGATGAAAHNDADVAFAQEMIPHHRQAVEMAALVPERSTDPRVRDLAARIQQAQDPEIATMTGWLQSWGAPVDGGGHAGMGRGDMSMPGMMTDEQMAQLRAARGAEFDRMWLTMMIAHHEGAVQMSRTELAQGADPAAKALAQQIIDGQQAEIDQMRGLLQG